MDLTTLPLAELVNYGVAGLMFAFAMWRDRAVRKDREANAAAHDRDRARWVEERAELIQERKDAVSDVRAQHREDDERKDRRIRELAEENDRLELAFDDERKARRMAEDQQTIQFPRHRTRDGGTAS